MRATRRGYLSSMFAGSAIIAACTFGAISAQTAVSADPAASGETLGGAGDPAVVAGAGATPPSTVSSAQQPAQVAGSGQAAGDGASTAAAAGPVPPGNESETESESGANPSSPPTRPTASPPARPTAPPPARPTASPPARPVVTAPAPVATKYKDGTYSATGSYNSPGGPEKLGVTLTLAGDRITASKLDLQGGAGISRSYQGLFQSGYAAQVVGRSVDSVHLGAVAGSSLTALGFNQALAQIESQARG